VKPLIVKIIVIIIAAAIVAPSAYFAYEYYSKSNVPQSVQPFEYIPGNSTMISTVHYNGSEYFLYIDGGSFGVVANISAISLTNSNLSGLNSQPAVSGTGNPFSGPNVKTITYDHTTVYEIRNVSISGILGILDNYSGNNLNNTTVNIFAYDTSGNLIVMGEQKAINESIASHMTSKDAVQFKSYLNQTSNISIYYRFNGTFYGISYITMNSTANKTYINIIWENKDYTVDNLFHSFISYSNLTGITGNIANTKSGSIIHLTVDKGYSSLPLLIKTLNNGVK
jgi:hypothetical protein